MMAALGILGFVLLLVFGVVQIYVGYLGIEYHLGPLWAWGAIAVMFVLRTSLPITIGTYFGAVDVLGWPWYGGLLLAAPGLLFIAPAAIAAVIETVRPR